MITDKEWLKTLKVGDKVGIESNSILGTTRTIRIIQKITPTGRIVVKDEQFINGEHRIDSWHSSHLVLITK